MSSETENLNLRLKRSMKEVKRCGRISKYGGVGLILGSIILACFELFRLKNVLELPDIKSNDSYEKIQSHIAEIKRDNESELEQFLSGETIDSFGRDLEAVIMGSKSSIIFAIGLHLAIYASFVLIGIRLRRALQPTLHLVEVIEKDGIDKVPEQMFKVIGFQEQQKQKHYAKKVFQVTLGTFLLIAFAALIDSLIKKQTLNKRAKLQMTLGSMLNNRKSSEKGNKNWVLFSKEKMTNTLAEMIAQEHDSQEVLENLEKDQNSLNDLLSLGLIIAQVLILVVAQRVFGRLKETQEEFSVCITKYRISNPPIKV